jgi:hypothetical protein
MSSHPKAVTRGNEVGTRGARLASFQPNQCAIAARTRREVLVTQPFEDRKRPIARRERFDGMAAAPEDHASLELDLGPKMISQGAAVSLFEGVQRGRGVAGQQPCSGHCEHRFAHEVVAASRLRMRDSAIEKFCRLLDCRDPTSQLAQTAQQHRSNVICSWVRDVQCVLQFHESVARIGACPPNERYRRLFVHRPRSSRAHGSSDGGGVLRGRGGAEIRRDGGI